MATALEQNAVVTSLRSWPERIRSFYHDVRTEMKKVTSPSLKEVQATTTVVLVTVFIFAFYFWAVDSIFTLGINQLLTKLVGPQ